MKSERGTRSPRSADFQSAVSRISNPPGIERTQAFGGSDTPASTYLWPTGSRRYSRLETCATMACGATNARLPRSIPQSDKGGSR
jgi:hypothetical protein